MDNTTKEVSEDVERAARKHASQKFWKGSVMWQAVYDAYIAGAYSQKPIEHSKLPEHENKK